MVLSAVKLNETAVVEHKFIELNDSFEITYLTIFFNKF